MAKRQQLNYNSDELALHLRQSTGQGVDALFSPPSPPRPVTPVAKKQAPDQSAYAGVHARTHTSQHTQRAISPEKPVQARRPEWCALDGGGGTHAMEQAVLVDRIVSVTPLSLDLTSRVAFSDLDALLRRANGG